MIVTVINKANPSHVVQFTAVSSYANNDVTATIIQDSVTYTFADSDYKFITINADA